MIAEKLKAIRWLVDQPDGEYEVKRFKPKRSELANRYFHRLVGLLARGEGVKFYQKKNELIMQYGNQEFIRKPNGDLDWVVKPDDDQWAADPVEHYVPTSHEYEVEGIKCRVFLRLKGTHTYNSSEMAYLIERTRDECIGCGIDEREVETPEQRHLMERLRRKTK